MNERDSSTGGQPTQGSGESQEQPPRIIRSEELLRGSREVHIQHGNDVYRLRLTRSGKLILYK